MNQGALPLKPQQGFALHPRRVFDPLDTLLAIELVTRSCSVRVFIQRTFGSKKKQYPKNMRVATEGVKGQRPLRHFFFNISRFVK